MDIEFKLIKVSWFKTLLRPLNLLLVFLPIYSYDKIECLVETNFWGYWGVFWIIAFFLHIILINRYKIIGEIRMNNKSINVINYAKTEVRFYPEQKLDISIQYNGYKGEKGNYKGPLQLEILTREGIGSMEIVKDETKYKYSFVALKKSSKRLNQLSDFYEKEGGIVNIIMN